MCCVVLRMHGRITVSCYTLAHQVEEWTGREL